MQISKLLKEYIIQAALPVFLLGPDSWMFNIDWINLYRVDHAIVFPNTYLLDSNLFVGKRFPMFEQQGPGYETV